MTWEPPPNLETIRSVGKGLLTSRVSNPRFITQLHYIIWGRSTGFGGLLLEGNTPIFWGQVFINPGSILLFFQTKLKGPP